MPSEAMFYPNMKVKDVIAFAVKSRKKDCSQEADKLCRLLEVPLEKKIEDLSLGNRKKEGNRKTYNDQIEITNKFEFVRR